MPDTVLHGGEPAPPYPPKQERLFLGPYPAAQVPQKLSQPSAGSSSGSRGGLREDHRSLDRPG